MNQTLLYYVVEHCDKPKMRKAIKSYFGSLICISCNGEKLIYDRSVIDRTVNNKVTDIFYGTVSTLYSKAAMYS